MWLKLGVLQFFETSSCMSWELFRCLKCLVIFSLNGEVEIYVVWSFIGDTAVFQNSVLVCVLFLQNLWYTNICINLYIVIGYSISEKKFALKVFHSKCSIISNFILYFYKYCKYKKVDFSPWLKLNHRNTRHKVRFFYFSFTFCYYGICAKDHK